jgi:hypothetical protein
MSVNYTDNGNIQFDANLSITQTSTLNTYYIDTIGTFEITPFINYIVVSTIKDTVPNTLWTNTSDQWDVACLLRGTKVKTPNGYRNIETLKVGDYVVSHRGNTVKIIKAHSWNVNWNDKISEESQVYVIENNKNKTYISAYHKLKNTKIDSSKKIKFINNEMVQACDIGLKHATKEEICDENGIYQLYNIQVENHERNHLIVNGGTIVESWDGKLFIKDNNINNNWLF